MAADPAPQQEQDDVRILPPDLTLQKKLGGAKLDNLFSAQAVQEAQQVIVESASDFIAEVQSDLTQLDTTAAELLANPTQKAALLGKIIETSFAIKAKAGQAEYKLVSILANSLHSRCELLGQNSLTPTNLSIIKWHVESMKQMLSMKIKGTGGAIGVAIIKELDTMAAAIGQTPPGNGT